MKDKLLKLLNAKNERKSTLATKATTTGDIAELRGINTELETLNSEIAELDGMIKEIEATEARSANPNDPNIAAIPPVEGTAITRGKSPLGKAQVIRTFGLDGGAEPSDQRATDEVLKTKY